MYVDPPVAMIEFKKILKQVQHDVLKTCRHPELVSGSTTRDTLHQFQLILKGHV